MAQSGLLSSIPKLTGRDNYGNWKFAMQAYLEHEELWGCVKGEEKSTADKAKVTKAKSKIILSIDPINYVHVQDTKTAKEGWDKLKTVFEDTGLTRKVGLLRKLVTNQLEKCKSVDEYVNEIISTAHKLDSIGTLLLAGLPDIYKPMIMGLESSGIKIMSDSVKTKILQDVKMENEAKNLESERAHLVLDRLILPGHLLNLCVLL